MKNMKTRYFLCIGLFMVATLSCMAQWKGKPVDFSHGALKVSDNKRFAA